MEKKSSLSMLATYTTARGDDCRKAHPKRKKERRGRTRGSRGSPWSVGGVTRFLSFLVFFFSLQLKSNDKLGRVNRKESEQQEQQDTHVMIVCVRERARAAVGDTRGGNQRWKKITRTKKLLSKNTQTWDTLEWVCCVCVYATTTTTTRRRGREKISRVTITGPLPSSLPPPPRRVHL